MSNIITPAFFVDLERQRTQALVQRDMPVIESLHAPEYELITPLGAVLSRERYLALVAEAPFYTAWEIGELRVQASAEMALLRYPAHLHFPSGMILHCWHLDSYVLRGGQWQALWSQATRITPQSS